MKSLGKVGFTAILALVICLVGVSWSVSSDSGPASKRESVQTASSPAGPDSNPTGKGEVVIPKEFQVPAGQETSPVGPTTVYFTPQDENTSCTVLFLYNTSSVDATVSLQTYYINGSLTIDTTINVPAHQLVRVCSDTVTTIAASWQNVVLVNFTDFSAYAKMTLPAGVHAEGYVAWNTTGVYDPLVATETLKLRFVKDLTQTSTVYFTPQDEDTSCTVLFLYNTSNVDATVPLQTFYLNGSLTINTTIPVSAHNLVRICSDSVSTIAASWQTPLLINFTDFSTYAQMTLPPGVKVEGYVAWNGANPYDPLVAMPTLELGFSSETPFSPAGIGLLLLQ